jgi:alkylation response protein AidB-like acyl-CoA dehydrogenase
MTSLTFAPPPEETEREAALRAEVRGFLSTELVSHSPASRSGSWFNFNAAFSRKLGEKGWIGMTWPKQFGGQERSALDRYIIVEELLAAGAPVGAHWIADRQSGPLLLRFGTEEQRQSILPRVARGECYFCIGMSEPDSGSDLSAVRTRAEAVSEGYRVNGTKIWTTFAHVAQYMILFCRTDTRSENRHAGFSQFLVDLKTPGIEIRPIFDLAGRHHFNEVIFDDVILPESALIGALGDGWSQVTSELAFERSGPERFLSSYVLLTELVRALGKSVDERAAIAVGRLAAHIIVLRRLSRSIAGMLETGADPAVQAALVKDIGNCLEQEIPEIARLLNSVEADLGSGDDYISTLAETILQAPIYSLRGGAREVLRGIIARGLGLR